MAGIAVSHDSPIREMDRGTRPARAMYWIEECLDATPGMGKWLTEDDLGQELAGDWYEPGTELHLSINAFLIQGSEESLVFDTLSRAGTDYIIDALTQCLDGDALDYVVPSHDEAPHAGNANAILEAFPTAQLVECTAGGSNPELHRIAYGDALKVTHGETIDLGGYRVEFVEPLFVDSAMTTWLFEHETRTLFTVDSFGLTHLAAACGQFSDEQASDLPAEQLLQYHGRSIQWLQYADADVINRALDALIEQYDPLLIAPSHGSVLRGNVDEYVEKAKQNIEWVTEHGQLEVNFSL